MSHTPGPWLSDGRTIYWTAPDTSNTWIVAQIVEPPVRPSEEATANANLIAAAPDLLEALRKLIAHQSFDTLRQARAAIAKAEGREP